VLFDDLCCYDNILQKINKNILQTDKKLCIIIYKIVNWGSVFSHDKI